MNTMTETRQVQVPHSYFQKAKAEYSDWRWAVIREFIQNSYDAQAATIDFRLTANTAGRIELQVDDDGIGMDEDTLLNVLLCMGGSRKLEGSIGGKGWAKAILFFAHHAYSIRTGNLRIDGSGGEYRLTVEPTGIAGTQIAVELGDESVLLESWHERIKTYVGSCFMEYATGRPVTVCLDGEVLPQNNEGIYSYAVQTSLGTMWYDETQGSRSAFVVTVAGLPMFVETFYSDTNQSALSGGLELDAGSAVLTANRDGFTSAVREQFSQIVGRLVQNQSAVRYGQALDLAINFAGGAARPAGNTSGAGGSAANGESSTPLLFVRQDTESGPLAGYAAALGRITHDRYPANFHLKVESLSVRRTATSQAYITAPLLVAAMNKQRSAKLAHSWRAVLMTILRCDWALANGVEFYDGQGLLIDNWDSKGSDVAGSQAFFRGRRIDAGFCFIANTGGLCSTSLGEQPHRIYVNPLLLTGEAAFRPGDTLDIAYHEGAHLWEHHHGEAFCSIESKLRQSVRRWLSERDMLCRIARAVPNVDCS